MDFQIKPLQATEFAHLFDLSDAELADRKACRQIVTSKPGTPCRVSLTDAEVGETVLLFNYVHQAEHSPYQASHAVFVREGATQATLSINEVPDVISTRLISMRLFDHNHMMIDADVVDGQEVGAQIQHAFDDDQVAYIHLHNAKPGCFAASAHRVKAA